MRHAAPHLFALSLVLAVPLGIVTPAPAADDPVAESHDETEEEERAAVVTLRGKLDVKTSKDAPPEVRLVVGDTSFLVEGAAEGASKLRRKLVEATGRVEYRDGAAVLVLDEPESIAEQEVSSVEGTVTADDEARSGLVLLGDDASWIVPHKAKRKFADFVGKHVVARSRVESGPGHRALVSVESVERKLLPGEREPESGEAALTGAWSGTLTATRVPSGIPGIEAGAELPLVFTTDIEAATTSGRLFDSYDVVGIRLRKYKAKRRTVEFDVDYSFGEGSYAVRFEGAFSEDWKTLTGEWRSGFLGEGTFDLRFSTED